jgi:hypothetical protein
MNRDRRDAQLLAGAQHPQGDLTPICYEDLVEHGQSSEWRTANGE